MNITSSDILSMTAQYLKNVTSQSTSKSTSEASSQSTSQSTSHHSSIETDYKSSSQFQGSDTTLSEICNTPMRTNCKASYKDNSKERFNAQTRDQLAMRISREFSNSLHGAPLLKVNEAPSGATFFFEQFNEYNGCHTAAWKMEKGWNNFLKAAVIAFAYHLPLRLKPDHILYAILSGFNLWVNAKGGHELLATKNLVDQTKKDINIDIPLNPDWDQAIDVLSRKLEQAFIDKNLVSVLKVQFSTTSPVINKVKNLTIASVMKKFVNISFTTMCGIPYVTLEGTKSDWEKLKVVANSLLSLADGQLNWWLEKLNKSLDIMIGTVDGNDLQHEWENFLNFKSQSGTHGCNGWINNFIPYIFDRSKNVIQNFAVTQDKQVSQKSVDFSDYIPSASSEIYNWMVMGRHHKNISITSGLLDVIQWIGEDFALEPFFGYQIDEIQ